MIQINQQILQKYGIYKTRTLTKQEQEKLVKTKEEIEKLINIPTERLYAINDFAWGKEPQNSKCSICILVDKRLKDLDDSKKILEDYIEKNNITIIFWTLCQFEKRKNAPTEEDYYIDKYGIKVYDSGKTPQINENVKISEYAAHKRYYKFFKSYIDPEPDNLMAELVRIYTLKIGYAVIGRKADLNRDIDFVKLISKDQKAIEIINNYLNQTEIRQKSEIINEFEQYLSTVKQVKFPMKLKQKPTMNIYEKLLKEKEEKGTLDIKTLTKEDLYTMYIIQNIGTYKIAKLYDVEKRQISSKRDNWNIKLKESAFIGQNNIMNKRTKTTPGGNPRHQYVLLKETGIMKFEKYALPILEYMLDENVYLLREFWQFTKEEKEESTQYPKNPFYKASMCLDLLLQNQLVEQVDFEQYKITKKGKDLVSYCQYNDIKEINIPLIAEKFGKVNYYSLYYTAGCPKEPKDVIMENIININKEKEENKIKSQKQNKEISIEEQISNLKQIDYNQVETKIKEKLSKNPKTPIGVKINYSKTDQAKADFGRKCENIIYEHEIKRLKAEGREDKVKEVIWVSRDLGDGFGYDIESYENRNGTYEKIYIEVKGTDKDPTEPFDVSINEIIVSEKHKENYYLYRIAKANSKNPIFYKIKGSISDNFELTAVKFKANIKNIK